MRKNILKISFVLLATLVFTTPVFALSENITQINFTSSVQTIDANTISATLSIQTQNAEEILEQTSETNHINLSTTSATGEFSSSSTNWNPVNTLTMSTGSANRNFYYRDSTPGTYTLTISAEGKTWTSATQDIIVVGNPITLSGIAVTTPAIKLNYAVGDTLDIAGLVVTGTYSDMSINVENITASDISGFDSSAPVAGQILTITVGAQTITYTIDINAADSVITPEHLNIEADVDVPASCSATDTDGVAHDYPEGNLYLAICALETAIKNGFISSVQLSNQFPNLGLFITAVNGVTADANSQYWAIYQNGGFANSGLASLPVVVGDVIMLQLHDFSDNNVGDQVVLNIHSLASNTLDNSGGGVNGTPAPTFSAIDALNYLKSVQGSDGSFGDSPLYSDWAGVAFGAMDVTGSSKNSLIEYLESENEISSLLTDNERRATALLSLGENPYSFKGVNYIGAIIGTFDGAQFGDIDLVNDDIFALIPLKNSGYTASDDIVVKDIAFLISKQKTDGSWEASTDITAATIQALKPFESIAGVSEALSKATDYLISGQNDDGGWNSVYSTSWTMQAMSALSASWTKNNKSSLDYLAEQQEEDGAVLPSSETLANRIWATSYAIPAGLQKTWSEIMQSVSKPAIQNDDRSGSSNSSPSPLKNTGMQVLVKPVICSPGNLFSITTGQLCTATAEPVICPIGDLFSTATGESCTTFVPRVIPTSSPQEQSAPELAPEPTLDSAPTISKEKVEVPIQENIGTDALTAAAVNALPIDDATTSQTIPIVLGIVSGIILLYLGFKFFVV